MIQEEPPEGSDPTTLGLFASIGIEKGKPFAPDARMKEILTDAANIGAATARALALDMRAPRCVLLSRQQEPAGGCRSSAATSSSRSRALSNLDGAAFDHFFATGVTPAMEEKMVGKGSQYPWTALDADGKPFDGGKTYKSTLPKRPGQGLLVGHRL